MIWRTGIVPYGRNAKFVDRDGLFNDLAAKMSVKEGSQARVALFGLGGIG